MPGEALQNRIPGAQQQKSSMSADSCLEKPYKTVSQERNNRRAACLRTHAKRSLTKPYPRSATTEEQHVCGLMPREALQSHIKKVLSLPRGIRERTKSL